MIPNNISSRIDDAIEEIIDRVELFNPMNTNEVQTLTFSGTPTGSFTISGESLTTASIAWSSDNPTLLANIDAALDATYGEGNLEASLGVITAGVGAVLLTFEGLYAARPMPLFTSSGLTTGTSAITRTALGALFVNPDKGVILVTSNVEPLPSQLPTVRLWYGDTNYHMGGNDFVIAGNVGGKSGMGVNVFLDQYWYSFDKNADGSPVDLQGQIIAVEENLIQWLSNVPSRIYPANTLWYTDTLWGFTRDQTVTGKFDSLAQRFGNAKMLPPPWYVRTLQFSIDVYP